MNGFNLRIVSPDGILYDGEADSIILRATEGDLCIQKNHADFTTTFGVTPVRISAGGEERRAACSNGFLTVSNNTVTVVATTFEFAHAIDLDRAKRAKERAEKILSLKSEEQNLALAEMKLKRALVRISVAENK